MRWGIEEAAFGSGETNAASPPTPTPPSPCPPPLARSYTPAPGPACGSNRIRLLRQQLTDQRFHRTALLGFFEPLTELAASDRDGNAIALHS